MTKISNFPYFEVQFNKSGSIHNIKEVTEIINYLKEGQPSDLFVISHGWNNTNIEARDLYKNLFQKIRDQINLNSLPQLKSKDFAVLGIFWPSIKFADKQLIPTGAANFNFSQNEDADIRQSLESLKGVFDHPEADLRLEKAKLLLNQIEFEPNAVVDLVNQIRSLPNKEQLHSDDNSDEFFKLPGNDLVEKLSRPDLHFQPAGGIGGAADFNSIPLEIEQGGAAFFDIVGGAKAAIRKVLNYTTYYQMKERAGKIGRIGAYSVLKQIKDIAPNLKIHLIGHSFGGRLVTALAEGPTDNEPIIPESMTLLQAAFSHNGFAEKFDGSRDGYFRKVIKNNKVKGPILITHSIKDYAVGIAYPIASKLSGDDSSDFGGPTDRFGGIGRNGAQFTLEADNCNPLGPVMTKYNFQNGTLYNLNADNLIMHHSDIIKEEIAHAVLSAVAST